MFNPAHIDQEVPVTLQEAKQLAIRLLAALDCQEGTEVGMTVQTMFEEYMRRHGDHKKSAKRIRQIYDHHVARFADRQVASLKVTEVLDWHAEIGTTIGLATANRALEVLRAAYNKSIKWGTHTGGNPCMSVSVFPLESRDRYMSQTDEIDRFMYALQTMRSTTFQNFTLTALFTAARVSNVQSMRWSDLDLEQRVWRIPDTKSGKPVLLPLIEEAVMAIESQRGKSPVWVFPGRGKTGHMANPARSWDRLMKKAGIENLHMHDLRRTMGSWEANTGASLHVIGKSLGHTSLRATHIYARLQLDPVREAFMRAAAAMLKR